MKTYEITRKELDMFCNMVIINFVYALTVCFFLCLSIVGYILFESLKIYCVLFILFADLMFYYWIKNVQKLYILVDAITSSELNRR